LGSSPPGSGSRVCLGELRNSRPQVPDPDSVLGSPGTRKLDNNPLRVPLRIPVGIPYAFLKDSLGIPLGFLKVSLRTHLRRSSRFLQDPSTNFIRIPAEDRLRIP